MRRALALFLVLLLVACGGGGGGDNDDDDTGAEQPTATARRAAATATAGDVSGSPVPARSTAVASPVRATAPAATATRRPATIVSKPKPIAGQATQAPIRPVSATATPPPTGGGGYEETFDDGTTEFETGTSESGVTVSVVDGHYQLDIPDGAGAYRARDPFLLDAIVAADASISGNGTAGLIGRGSSRDGEVSLYLCWLDASSTAGCHILLAGEWSPIFATEEGTVPVQPVNRLVFTIVGTSLYFDVNGVNVIQLDDANINVDGQWGVYGDSLGGPVTVTFDWVAVAATDEYLPPAPVAGGAIPFEEFTIGYEENFDDGTTDLATGPTDIGISSGVVDGAYVVEFPDQAWSTFPVATVEILGDGLVAVNTAIVGEGVMGLVARSFGFEDGTFDYYLCWLSTENTAGCHKIVKNEWTQLWVSEAEAVPVQEVNELVLAVVGSQLTFMVNGEAVVTLEDTSIVDGYWGLYGQSFSGTTTVAFDDLIIASWTGGS